MGALRNKFYEDYINDMPGLSLTDFTLRSMFSPKKSFYGNINKVSLGMLLCGENLSELYSRYVVLTLATNRQ